MALADLRQGYKNSAWFTGNPTLVLKQGQVVHLLQTGQYKLGDGTTQLSALSFLGSTPVTGFVPYTGATADVDLGVHNMNARSFSVTGVNGNGHIHLKHQSIDAGSTGSSTTLFADVNGNLAYKNDGNPYVRFISHTNTANRSYTLPNANGTIALTSDLSPYLLASTAASTYQPLLGFTAENVANKAINFATLNNTLYPTTQAVSNYVTGLGYITSAALSPYLLASTAASTYQPIGSYLTTNQTITLSGVVTGSGTTAITTAFASTTGSGAVVLATSPTFITDITTPRIIGGTGVGSVIQYIGTSGNGTSSISAHEFLVGNNGATSAVKIFNSSHVSVGNYASPTNLRIFTVGQDTAFMSFGSLVSSTGSSAIYFNQASPNVSNAALYGASTATNLNATSTVQLTINTSAIVSCTNTTITQTPQPATSGVITTFQFTKPNNTGQTAGTNIPGYLITTGSRQWATGAIALQEEVRITAPTYSFVGLSTITDAATLSVNAPIAGTNATITNAWAIRTNGGLLINAIANTVLSNAALATTATNGFLYLPTTAGTPTGTPTAFTGTAPILVDTTNNTLSFYSSGAWRNLSVGGGGSLISGTANVNFVNETVKEITINTTSVLTTSYILITFAMSSTKDMDELDFYKPFVTYGKIVNGTSFNVRVCLDAPTTNNFKIDYQIIN